MRHFGEMNEYSAGFQPAGSRRVLAEEASKRLAERGSSLALTPANAAATAAGRRLQRPLSHTDTVHTSEWEESGFGAAF